MKKPYLFVAIFLHLSFLLFVKKMLPSLDFESSIFAGRLVNLNTALQFYALVLISLLNLWFLFGFLEGLKLGKLIYFLTIFLYSFSPWIAYLVAGGSVYFIAVSLYFYAFIAYHYSPDKPWSTIFVCLPAYFMPTLLLVSALTLVYLSLVKVVKKPLIGVLMFVPITALVIFNFPAAKNLSLNEITFLRDPGILNSTNLFRGETLGLTQKVISKLFENKYLFFSFAWVIKIVNFFIPAVYFSSYVVPFDFSFVSPIMLAFVAPLISGLFELRTIKKKFFLPLAIVFTLPALFSSSIYDMNRLVLLFPFIVVLIVLGLRKLNSKILATVMVLAILQTAFILFDISTKEDARYNHANMEMAANSQK